MKLPASQLSAHLARDLKGFYLIASDEPLLVQEAGDAIRRAAFAAGFEERAVHAVDRGFKWDELIGDAGSRSLFATRRIIEVRMPTPRPGDAGSKAIRLLAEQQDADRLVILSIHARLDRSTARAVWVQTVERHGVCVEIRPVTRAELPAFIARRARAHGLEIARDASEALADRVEGNLLAADQELAKLALIGPGGEVGVDAVLSSVAASARYDVFRLGDAVVAGEIGRAMTVLDGLESEGVAPPLVLWALVRELDLLCRLHHGVAAGRSPGQLMRELRVWQSRQPALTRALGRFDGSDLADLLDHAARVDRAVKGDGVPAWTALRGLVLAMLDPRIRWLAAC